MSKSLDEWVDDNAIDLKEGIKISFEMFYDDAFEQEFIRATMTLIRQRFKEIIDSRDRLASELAEAKRKLELWETEVSKEMPPDFKDWWQNSKEEWPIVARLVLENRRRDAEEAWEMIKSQVQNSWRTNE